MWIGTFTFFASVHLDHKRAGERIAVVLVTIFYFLLFSKFFSAYLFVVSNMPAAIFPLHNFLSDLKKTLHL